MSYVPSDPTLVLTHDRATTIYGYRVEVIAVDIGQDTVTYQDLGMPGAPYTRSRVDYLQMIGMVDEANALREWYTQYKEELEK